MNKKIIKDEIVEAIAIILQSNLTCMMEWEVEIDLKVTAGDQEEHIPFIIKSCDVTSTLAADKLDKWIADRSSPMPSSVIGGMEILKDTFEPHLNDYRHDPIYQFLNDRAKMTGDYSEVQKYVQSIPVNGIAYLINPDVHIHQQKPMDVAELRKYMAFTDPALGIGITDEVNNIKPLDIFTTAGFKYDYDKAAHETLADLVEHYNRLAGIPPDEAAIKMLELITLYVKEMCTAFQLPLPNLKKPHT